MTVFLAYALISVLFVYGIKEGTLKEKHALHFVVLLYAVSMTPSIAIPYIIDDMRHLPLLSEAIDSSRVMSWLFTPHNEHVIPLIKVLYFIFYKYFWLYPQAFHAIIICVCAGVLYGTRALVLTLTRSETAAFFAVVLLAASNLMDMAAFVITNSHIIFCLLFFILLFTAFYKYFETGRRKWFVFVIVIILCVPATFALGLISVLFVFLFKELVLPPELKQKRSRIMFAAVLACLVSALPYALKLGDVLFTRHYLYVNEASAMSSAKYLMGAWYVVQYYYQDLVPHVVSETYFAVFLFFCAVACAVKYRDPWSLKASAFFAVFGSVIFWIITTFRLSFGVETLSWSRYSVFPVFMLVMIYALAVARFLKDEKNACLLQKRKQVVTLVLLMLVSFAGSIRYQKAAVVAKDTSNIIQRLNIEYREAIKTYIGFLPEGERLMIRDFFIDSPVAYSLTTEKGANPGLGFPIKVSALSQYVLSKDLRNRIVWGQVTDKKFVAYLQRKQDVFPETFFIFQQEETGDPVSPKPVQD